MNLQKYVTAVELMNKIVDAAALPIPEGGESWTLPCKAWDELYEFIYLNFANPVSSKNTNEYVTDKKLTNETRKSVEEEIQECREMLKIGDMEVILNKIKSLPPEFTDMIFPVAIARFILCVSWDTSRPAADIVPAKLKTFEEFHKRYGTMIISSARYYK